MNVQSYFVWDACVEDVVGELAFAPASALEEDHDCPEGACRDGAAVLVLVLEMVLVVEGLVLASLMEEVVCATYLR